MISFTREELLNIWQNILQNLLPVFDYSDVLLDIVVGERRRCSDVSGCAHGGNAPVHS